MQGWKIGCAEFLNQVEQRDSVSPLIDDAAI